MPVYGQYSNFSDQCYLHDVFYICADFHPGTFISSTQNKLDIATHVVIPALRTRRQEDCEFEVKLKNR
jgi:hypothetical protein